MSRRITDKQKERLAIARLREQRIKAKTGALGITASGNCPSQLVSLIPTLKQGKSEKTNLRIKPYDKGLGISKVLGWGVRKGLIGMYESPKTGSK